MSKIITYACDNCGEILSNENTSKEHLSIRLSEYSGWVKKNELSQWNHTKKVSGVLQFCGGDCLCEYFDKLK